MGDTKAEEDDDEGFGDFTFASSFPNSAPHSDQINGRKSTLYNDDDDWGDFVESSLRSELSSGIFNIQSPSIAPLSSKPPDPFGFFSDQSQFTVRPTELEPSRAESEMTQWVKPKGALPLSIFGDVDHEKEQPDVVDPPFDDAEDSIVDIKDGTNMVAGLAVNETISNLYNLTERTKAENGFKADSNRSDPNVIETNPNLNGAITREMNSIPDLFVGNNHIQSPQINTVSGVSQNSDWFFESDNPQSQQIKAVSGLNTHSDLFGGQQIKVVSGLNSYSSGMSMNTDLFSGNIDFDAITNIFSQDQENNFETSNGLSSNSSPIVQFMDTFSDSLGANEELDGDYAGWEFKDAFSEPKAGVASDKVDMKEEGNFGVTGFSFEFGNGLHGSDLFSSSNGFSVQPKEVDVSFDFKPLTVVQNELNGIENGSDSFFKSELNGIENGLKFDHIVGTVESDESFGDFEGAFTEIGSNQKGNETVSNNHSGALPLSIFGDEELETDDSNFQDAFTSKPSYPRNGINSQGSNISINDLISNLYSQAEQIPSIDKTGKHTGNGLVISDEALDRSLVNSDDDFEDASWDFKDASIQTNAVDQTSVRSHGDTFHNYTTNLKMINYVDFYSKLKNELPFVCRGHLDNLKRAKYTAALSGEDAKATVIEEEIQEACKELDRENIHHKECPEDELPRDSSLSEFIEVSKMKFQVLESEYGLSGRLHLAEKDLRSAIELMKHATSMLDVLTLGSMEDQGIYVSTWSKIISVCVQELKHGSWIWKQLVEKNIQNEILSEPRGKGLILALGEIYRVVAVLGASAKLYKPWILSSSIVSTSIYALLEECYTLWSSSGIEEALQHISDPIDFDYHSTVKALRESIRSIHDRDELTFGNHRLNKQVSICRLSLLTSEAVPDVKMVLWNGEYYFLPIANFWANLISCDPPELPYLDVGS